MAELKVCPNHPEHGERVVIGFYDAETGAEARVIACPDCFIHDQITEVR